MHNTECIRINRFVNWLKVKGNAIGNRDLRLLHITMLATQTIRFKHHILRVSHTNSNALLSPEKSYGWGNAI